VDLGTALFDVRLDLSVPSGGVGTFLADHSTLSKRWEARFVRASLTVYQTV
jgi:hypothetical protein